MILNYVKLCEVKFFHQYYGAFTSKDFTIFPSDETREFLKSYGILFKPSPEGFVLLCNEAKHVLIQRLKSPVSLFFCLEASNKHFSTFSLVDSTMGNRKYFFGNRNLEKQQIKIHPNFFVNENDVYLSAHKNLNIKGLLNKDKVLVEQFGQVSYEGDLTEGLDPNIIFPNGHGSYDVTLEETEKVKFLYLPESFYKGLGVIELVLEGSNRFDELLGSVYQIHFDSRSIQWNYFFVSNTELEYESIEIYTGKEKLNFSAPVPVTLLNGQTAYKVSSKDYIPLKIRYESKGFFAELKRKENNILVSKKVNLLTPDITRIKGKRENNTEIFFSDMYIYL